VTDSPSPDQFPVDSFKEAREHLRRPFTRSAVKFKVVGGNNVAVYIDARLASERLNLVIPNWDDDYELINPKAMWCHLTVGGVTRSDIGEGGTLKALRSDSLKRAAVSFGVGVPNYAIPAAQVDSKYLEQVGKSRIITPDGRAHLRDRYDAWLEAGGQRLFGDPLDHGDEEDASGDFEVEEEATTAVDDAPPDPEALTDPEALALVERAEALHKNVPLQAMPPAAFRRQLEGAKSSMPDLEALVAQLEEMQE
jgi:hypothetical protein